MIAAAATLFITCAAQAADNTPARIRAFESSLGPPIGVVGEPAERWTLAERMAHWKVPGLSVAVIREGKVAWAKGYGVLSAGGTEKVNTDTVFSVGSVSKVGAAAVTLRLVDAGKLDLDRNVNAYLSRWRVPDNAFTALRPVTLRGILSHSAGLSVHGFGDFQPDAALPTVIDTLEGRAPADNGPVRVIQVPGSRFRYSGGGTQVEQLVIEEVTHLGFPQAARQYVFEPLRMTRSTYENPLPPSHGNIAKAHGEDGQPRALPRGYEAMPEMAASGLWTTPSDYAKLVIAFIQSYQGKGTFLSNALAHEMLTEVGRSFVGLGPFLDGEGLERRFYHGGSNDSYKAWMEGHPGTGNGVVIFTNGANGSELDAEVRRAVARAEGWSTALSGRRDVPDIKLSASELSEKAGVYEIVSNDSVVSVRSGSEALAYHVRYKDGVLSLSTDASSQGRPLVPMEASRFMLVSGRDLLTVEFVRDYDGQVSGLVLRNGTLYAIEARRLPTRPANP